MGLTGYKQVMMYKNYLSFIPEQYRNDILYRQKKLHAEEKEQKQEPKGTKQESKSEVMTTIQGHTHLYQVLRSLCSVLLLRSSWIESTSGKAWFSQFFCTSLPFQRRNSNAPMFPQQNYSLSSQRRNIYPHTAATL
jgi:hypothetical protein